jgi:preprotein translocase subunit YajC
MASIPLLVLFFVAAYFLLLRPQQQRVRRQRDLVTGIAVGDHVVTAGGIVGNVVGVNDDRMQLEVADGVVMEFLRLSVSRRIEAGVPFWGTSSGDDEEAEEEEYGEGEYEEEAGEESAESDPAESDHEVESADGDAGDSDGEVAASDDVEAGDGTTAAGTDGSIEEGAVPAPGQDPH